MHTVFLKRFLLVHHKATFGKKTNKKEGSAASMKAEVPGKGPKKTHRNNLRMFN